MERRRAPTNLLTAQDVEIPTPPTSSGTCARNCLPRPGCSPRSNATARRPPTPSTPKSARIARDDAAKELKRVEHVGSALPEFALAMRDTSARSRRRRRQLPYIAELLDLKPTRPAGASAVEKVLRGAGCGCWFPTSTGTKVLRFVNETDMRGRLQLHHVRRSCSAPNPSIPSRTRWRASCSPSIPPSVRRRGRRRHHRRRRPLCASTPPTSSPGSAARSPTPACTRTPSGWRSRTTGDPSSSPSTCTRATSTAKINALTLELAAAEETSEGPAHKPTRSPRSASSGATAPRRARRSAAVPRNRRSRSTPRPPTATPTGCVSSTSC